MCIFPTRLSACLSAALLVSSALPASASLVLTTGLNTTHAGNLVVNGSFEIGAPPDNFGNANYWADPSNSPYVVPPGWASAGVNNTAAWGNDSGSPYRLRSSDLLPDGRVGVDFHTVTGVTVNLPPTFNPDGSVTFPGTPSFSGPPVRLSQIVNTQLTPAPSYNMSFWVSAEENSTVQGFTGVNILGLRVTNVLPGDPIQWLAVPNGLLYGQSKKYEYTFTPLNPLAPVEIRFLSWGGLDLSPHGLSAFGAQPILDDVIINAVNAVPEPATAGLVLAGLAAMGCVRIGHRRRISRIR